MDVKDFTEYLEQSMKKSLDPETDPHFGGVLFSPEELAAVTKLIDQYVRNLRV